jgi:hypothetical protein
MMAIPRDAVENLYEAMQEENTEEEEFTRDSKVDPTMLPPG